jgi:hypothetical protein
VRSRSARRDLSKGERAMALAFLYPEAEKGGRAKKGKAEETSDFSQKRLAQARAVLRHSVEFAEKVRDGEDRARADRREASLVKIGTQGDRAAHPRQGARIRLRMAPGCPIF